MKPVVFSSHVPLTETILRLFPMDFLASRGARVQYWDISPLFGHGLPGKELQRPYVRKFSRWEDLGAAIASAQTEETLLVVAVPREPKFFRLHRLLGRCRLQLGSVIVGNLPMPPSSPLQRLKNNAPLLVDPGKISHLLLKRAQNLLGRLGATRPFQVIFAAGESARLEAGGARVVPINHYDYDEWLETRATAPRLVEGRYAVYLDEFAPFHPDFKLLGVKTMIDAPRHYALLNAYFSRLENRHNLKVVIAAHPKSDYPDNPFQGRRIIRSSTCSLVAHCEFALAVHSTSMGLAVLFRKPLIFFTTNDIAARYRRLLIDAISAHCARALGRPQINLDSPAESDLHVDTVDAALYDDYKYRYLASRESENKFSRDIYLDFLSRA